MRRTAFRGAVCGYALLAWVVLAPRTAHAEAPAGAAAADASAEARDAYAAGLERFRAHDYAGAVREFERAHASYPKPELLYDIAQAQRLNGDCSAALESYDRFLATEPREPLRSRAQARRADMQGCAVQPETHVPKTDTTARPSEPIVPSGSTTAPHPTEVAGGTSPPVAAPPPPSSRATTTFAVPLPVVIGTGTLAVGSALVGVVAYTKYASANERAEALCPDTPPVACSETDLREHARLTEDARAARTWFYVGVGTAAAATAVTVTLLAWPKTRTHGTAQSVRLEAGLRGGAPGARVSVTW